MAHSFILAHEDETAAFERFAEANPDNVVLLIDTYDSKMGAAKVVALAGRLRQRGITVRAVRLDSGDIARLAFEVRRILDDGGLGDVKIFASGNLDEYSLRDLVTAGTPIDGFGIGTRLDVSDDAPVSRMRPTSFRSMLAKPGENDRRGKPTGPGEQVYRTLRKGVLHQDVVTLDSDIRLGEPLLQPVMESGQRINPPLPLEQIRQFAAEELKRLPAAWLGTSRQITRSRSPRYCGNWQLRWMPPPLTRIVHDVTLSAARE